MWICHYIFARITILSNERVECDTMKRRKRVAKLNNAGVTMAELIVTFALLGIFMVAATRVIAYTSGIYYAARGASYGMEVSDMIAGKIIGHLEGADRTMEPVITKGSQHDQIAFVDETGSSVEITAGAINGSSDGSRSYMKIHYNEVTEGTLPYDAVDWTFDPKAYMGYEIKSLQFEDPDQADPGADAYPDNVIKMTLVVNSDKYGDYKSTYYIKCIHVDKVIY